MKSSTRVLLILLLILLLGVFIFCGIQLYGIYKDYYDGRKANNSFAELAVSMNPDYHETVVEFPMTTLVPVNGDSQDPTSHRPTSEPDRPDTPGERSPITVDFPALFEINEDIKAWLYSPDTIINYAVVQGDDNSYYLHRLADKSYNPGGSLFIDYRCADDFSGKNTIIYGHHMGDGSMLASIVEYRNQEYYDAHPVMYLNTPEGNYRLDIVTGFITYFDSRAYLYDFESRTEFDEWFALMRSYSDFVSEVEVGSDDRLVTLSTCTYEYDNARYVLMAKLVPIN